MTERNPEVSCGNCVGACCRGGLAMELTLEEVSEMLKAGNRFTTLHSPVHEEGPVRTRRLLGYTIIEGMACAIVDEDTHILTAGHGLYLLREDCVFLEKGKDSPRCLAYEERPGICREFEMGGTGCLHAREDTYKTGRYPNWQPVELIEK